jgi:hypothetical protein
MSDLAVVRSSVDDLLAGASHVVPIDSAGKSGARLDRLRIDCEAYVVEYLDPDHDWTMRAAGVDGGATLELWRRGILARLPACIDQPIVGVARDGVTVLLMRDVGDWLVPVSDHPIPLEQHLRFLDAMAALHAHFWETGLGIDIVSPRTRYLELSLHTAEREAALGSPHLVPRLVAEGWPLFARVARGRPGSSRRCRSSPHPWSPPWARHRPPWSTATGSSTTLAPPPAVAPSCSTGSCPDVAPR